MYQEMGSRHRVRSPCIQIIKTATIAAAQVGAAGLPQRAGLGGCRLVRPLGATRASSQGTKGGAGWVDCY